MVEFIHCRTQNSYFLEYIKGLVNSLSIIVQSCPVSRIDYINSWTQSETKPLYKLDKCLTTSMKLKIHETKNTRS